MEANFPFLYATGTAGAAAPAPGENLKNYFFSPPPSF